MTGVHAILFVIAGAVGALIVRRLVVRAAAVYVRRWPRLWLETVMRAQDKLDCERNRLYRTYPVTKLRTQGDK